LRQPEVVLRFFKPSLLAEIRGVDTPGRIEAVTDRGLLVTTGSGILSVGELQRPGGRRLPVADFVRGHGIQAGDLLVPS
jgi:methionyl-tRNA formyltransferase